MAEADNTDNQRERINTESSAPSFLSPVVGEMSMEYSIAFDDDEVMGVSPLPPSMSVHPPLHTGTVNQYSRDRNRNPQMPSNGHATDYEANYGIDNDQYIYNVNDSNADNDLQTPLIGYNYNHDQNGDVDDDRYHHRNTHDQTHRSYEQLRNVRPKLNGLNYLNVITYGLNVFTSYFVGVRGLFGVLPTRRDIFIQYETLVTPADFAYWLWAPILVFELFFATAQLLPHYRARPMVQQGTGLYFFWACIIQTIWTVLFAKKWFLASFISVVLALLCMVLLLASQHYNCLVAPTARGRGGMTILGMLAAATRAPPRQRRKSLLEYWFFRFPFYLHCGWLLVCMVVQFSMAFRFKFTHSTGAQLTADIVALGVMLPPATFFLTGQSSGPDFVIPVVVVWSYISIAVELYDPSETLIILYGHPAILAMQNAAYTFAGVIVLMLVPRIFIWIAQEFCTIDVVELDDEEDNISTTFDEVRFGLSDGLLQRFSLRRGVEVDESPPSSDPVVETGGGEDDEENLGSVRRRIENEEGVGVEGDDDDDDEDQFEDCNETEDETDYSDSQQ